MMTYDLTRLNDKEFEMLSVDLLSKVEGKRIERFKSGKDAGVDGRFYQSDDSEVIIQCKHWAKSGIKPLLKHLKDKESIKVKKLNPDRYIFTTSVELSRHNKKKIKDIFEPFIKDESDIYGNEDINDFISKHEDIEKRHYKLWLFSSNVLRRLLNSGIIGRSDSKIQDILEFSRKYVVTNNHERAIKKLNAFRSIIITGEPGIGKTVLANQLCLHYLKEDYELCYIEDCLSEAENVYSKDKKQLFYFDDFLGRNYLLALNRHEDSRVLNFIKRVGRDKDKLFILTSRSTVLNQGKRLSELYEIENIDKNEYEIKIQSLSGLDKAKILYNHIWFSELKISYIDELYKDNRYLNIIRHPNYNPRLISFITDYCKISDIAPNNYWKYIKKTLKNPEDIWGHVYEHQIDEACRIIVSLIVFNSRSISEKELQDSFRNICRCKLWGVKHVDPMDFKAALKLATGAIINRTIDGTTQEVWYDLFNPAVGDYVLNMFSKEPDRLDGIFLSLNTLNSLYNIESLLNSEIYDSAKINEIIKIVTLRCLNSTEFNKGMSYKIRLLQIVVKKNEVDIALKEQIAMFLKSLDFSLISSTWISAIIEIYFWCLDKKIIEENDVNFLPFLDNNLDYDLEHDDFVWISKLLERGSIANSQRYLLVLQDLIVCYWKDTIENHINEEAVLEDFLFEEDYDDAEIKLRTYIANNFEKYSIEFEEDIIDEILGECDLDDIIMANQDKEMRLEKYCEEDYYESSSGETENDIIHDLFQRD
ncbi:MAG: restriction endonuclease [Sedimentisphaeraceae bacterium JB056]